MVFYTFGDKANKLIIMLSGSFCNANSMEYLYCEMKDNYYIIVPEYNGHYLGTTFTTRENESREIIDYLKGNGIETVDLIYGQSMGAEIGVELMHQLLKSGIEVKKGFFDGAPCIKLSFLYKKFMNFKFKTMINMLKDRKVDEVINWKFLKNSQMVIPKACDQC